MEPAALERKLPESMKTLCEGLALRIVGMEDVVEQVLYCLLAGGHGLIMGVPGLAKTLLCSSLAEMLDLEFKRIQFTPDLMPGDIAGTETLGDLPEGGRGFRYVPGPIFTNLLLADEINRTPPKTQAALMEGMEERMVTSGGKRRPLPEPFLVLATQNPIEQEGTYELPAAQLDRFLLRIEVDYPEAADEKLIVRRTTSGRAAELPRVLSRAEILDLQAVLRAARTPDAVARYATDLARATRPGEGSAPTLGNLVQWGAGPRAAQSLVVAAKARALMAGRREPTAEDVRAVLPSVMRHRIIPSYAAAAENVTVDDIVRRVRDAVVAPDGWTPAPAVVEETGFIAKLLRKGTKAAG